MGRTDWAEWHEAYGRPGSGLADRLTAVQALVHHGLDELPGTGRVISACAGDGRDVLDVLTDRQDSGRVEGLLVELDPRLVGRARERARQTAARIEVRQSDAARSDTYADAAPADLILLCGIFGNISDEDVRTTIVSAAQLCGPGALVIWTRHRDPPDLTPRIRDWFVDAGFEEVAFVAPADDWWAVGAHRLLAEPTELVPGQQWFRFLR